MNKDTKFLIVDDFNTTRRIIRQMLKQMGFENVVEADDGKTAWPILEQGDIDFLLTDWNMPIVTGIDLVKQVRENDALSKMPVLMITAEAHHDQIVSAAKAGIDGYIIKPFKADILKEKIEECFATNTGGEEARGGIADKYKEEVGE